MHFVEPVAGELACKTVGTGKLEDVENIVKQALRLLSEPGAVATGLRVRDGENHPVGQTPPPLLRKEGSHDLDGEHFLITVGGTREAIDPVRFISNHSSGKMGFAVAEAAAARGAKVTVVAGVTTVEPPANVNVIRAVSAEDMHDRRQRRDCKCDSFCRCGGGCGLCSGKSLRMPRSKKTAAM